MSPYFYSMTVLLCQAAIEREGQRGQGSLIVLAGLLSNEENQ